MASELIPKVAGGLPEALHAEEPVSVADEALHSCPEGEIGQSLKSELPFQQPEVITAPSFLPHVAGTPSTWPTYFEYPYYEIPTANFDFYQYPYLYNCGAAIYEAPSFYAFPQYSLATESFGLPAATMASPDPGLYVSPYMGSYTGVLDGSTTVVSPVVSYGMLGFPTDAMLYPSGFIWPTRISPSIMSKVINKDKSTTRLKRHHTLTGDRESHARDDNINYRTDSSNEKWLDMQESTDPQHGQVVGISEQGMHYIPSDLRLVFPNGEPYNSSDFTNVYGYAKHFIIKSYSEFNVLKSIEHGVWASTSEGNKKLDEAYRDAQQQAALNSQCGSPVFLYFSVNGSGQFCGVAEMTGPVNYNGTMGFWEQHKWFGSFALRWHIIKDLPNSQLHTIILPNNENKPVTNSRNTQEVYHQQGLEMLNIFKQYPSRSSILDGSFLCTALRNQTAHILHYIPKFRDEKVNDEEVIKAIESKHETEFINHKKNDAWTVIV